ncbi:DUF6670 family protein [Acinetobacter sp. WZC-1]|uniref:DUF6670 family protein n=1 Tax=Acinetobacter sp. WZC-1 TaxID=3459034 RepID=UPI00403D7243
MQLLMNLEDHARQLNQARPSLELSCSPPGGWFKIVYQGLILPGLAAPLHYFNFQTLMGQPNIPILRNAQAIKTTALDTAAVISSVSPQMTGHFNSYGIETECSLQCEEYQFGERERLTGTFPEFTLQRQDEELSVYLNIRTQPVVSHFSRMKLGLFEHWSVLCQCRGEITYRHQRFQIDQAGAFEYARAINIPYLPICFFIYQIINLKDQRQLLLTQLRNNFNQVIQSRIYLRDLSTQTSELFDEQVYFKVHRVYPCVTTPNRQDMYLPREFEWSYSDGKRKIQVCGQSRGDFKSGLTAGYVGSFRYQLQIDDHQEQGVAGYCEYIDCRPLKWQEKNSKESKMAHLVQSAPAALKNKQKL